MVICCSSNVDVVWLLKLVTGVQFLDHVGLFQGSPSVLEVDVASVLEGVIRSDFTPVARSKLFHSFYELPCLSLCPHLLRRQNIGLSLISTS